MRRAVSSAAVRSPRKHGHLAGVLYPRWLSKGPVVGPQLPESGRLDSNIGSTLAELLAPPTWQKIDNLLLSHGIIDKRKQTRQVLRHHDVYASVVINGQRRGPPERITSKSTRVDPSTTVINGFQLEDPGHLHLVMNKPRGYVCSHVDDGGPSIYRLLPEDFLCRRPYLHSVGRLDRMASGLLLFTTAGDLTVRLTSPQRGMSRTYTVRLERPLSQDGWEASSFASGHLQLINGHICRPATLVPHPTDRTLALVTVWEGSHRQVRRMFAAVGNRVMALQRTHMGRLQLSATGLAEGEWRRLKPHELYTLLQDSDRTRRGAAYLKRAALEEEEATRRLAAGRRRASAQAALAAPADGAPTGGGDGEEEGFQDAGSIVGMLDDDELGALERHLRLVREEAEPGA